MSFEQISTSADNEIIIERKSWFGRYIKFSIKASATSLPNILKLCDRHLGGEQTPRLVIPATEPTASEKEENGLASK